MRLFGFTACLIVVLASTAAAGPVGLADSGTAHGEHIAVGLEDAFPGWAHESTALADSVLAKIAAERDHWTEGLPAFVETLPTVDSEACTQDPATCQPMVASALVLIAACVAGAQQCGAFPDRMVDRPGNCPGSTPNEPDIMWAFGRPWLSDPVRSAFISAERYVPYGSYQVAVYTLSHPQTGVYGLRDDALDDALGVVAFALEVGGPWPNPLYSAAVRLVLGSPSVREALYGDTLPDPLAFVYWAWMEYHPNPGHGPPP